MNMEQKKSSRRQPIIIEKIWDDILSGTYQFRLSFSASGTVTIPKALTEAVKKLDKQYLQMYYSFKEGVIRLKVEDSILPGYRQIKPSGGIISLPMNLTEQHKNKFYGRIKLTGTYCSKNQEFLFPLVIPEQAKIPPYERDKKS